MAGSWDKRRLWRWALGLSVATGCTLAVLFTVGLRAASTRLEPDAAGWDAAARAFHGRAAEEKARDQVRRTPVLVGAVVSANAATGYVRALQLVREQANPPWLGRNLQQLARIHPGPGGEDKDAARERAYLDANRAAIAALVSATHCEQVSWGVDFESDEDHQALPGPRARLFGPALNPLGDGCLSISREKALAGDQGGALEYALGAARWAIDECPTVSSHRAALSRLSAEQLGWLATKLPPPWLTEHEAEVRRALEALDAAVPSSLEQIESLRFELERDMVFVSESMERDCERIPLLGSFAKTYSAPLARAFASQDASFNRRRELLIEGEKAAAIPDLLERRRALEAIDARWPRAKPEDEPPGYLAATMNGSENEHARLALARAVVEIEARFEHEGRAPREWELPRCPSGEPWVYQPRDDGQGWRVVTLIRFGTFAVVPSRATGESFKRPIVLYER